MSTCVAQLAKERTSDLDVTGSLPPISTRHTSIRRVLLSSTKLNLLSWLLIYLNNKYSALHKNMFIGAPLSI